MKRASAALVAAGLLMATASLAYAQDAAKADATKGDATTGDAAKGEQLFKRCEACHALDHAVVGPPLGGVIGRKAGSVEGYSYSPLMKAAGDAGLVWTQPEVVDYLHNPTEYLTNFVKSKGKDAPGSSKMIFQMSNETQRRNVAAYLATTSKP